MIEEKIDSIDNSIENIKTIPGVSDKTISAVLGECGDIKRFNLQNLLLAILDYIPLNINLEILTCW